MAIQYLSALIVMILVKVSVTVPSISGISGVAGLALFYLSDQILLFGCPMFALKSGGFELGDP
jgi:hypothetical protein